MAREKGETHMIHRAYMVLLVALLSLSVRAAPTDVEPPTSSAVNDAGLWLLVGGVAGAAAGTGVALMLDVKQADPMPFEERTTLRTVGVTSALLAGVAGAVAVTGGVMWLWPAE